jgi:cyclophilin family peptidyl-prolyl cis-trans isomerase
MTLRRRAFAALLCCLVTGLALAVVPVPSPSPAIEAVTPAPPSPRVALETSLGRIVLELYPQRAPETVANFLAYARSGHYNGTVFHRAIYGVLVQGGGYTPDLQPKPERQPVANEAGNGLRNTRGTIAAARRHQVADSAGAQFFINLGDNASFDRQAPEPAEASGYCVFGRVIEGLDVADRIAALPTAAREPFDADVPVTAVVIESTEILPPAPVVPAAAPETTVETPSR